MIIWNIKRWYKKLFVVGEGKTNSQKITLFIYSIFVGLLVALVFVSFFKANPFESLFKGIARSFTTDLKIRLMVSRFVVLGLAGIAIGVGFKTGIFNIGVSGQMIMAGISAGFLALKLGDKVPNGAGQMIIILICLFAGSIFAGIAGVLKAYFNIHEVVSTILMNWIAFFFMKWMFDPNTSQLLNTRMDSSKPINPNYLLRIDDSPLYPILIVLFVTSVLLWIFIYKTRYGMILKMTSLNSSASKYAGVNTKLVIIFSMMLSGAIAGLLGAVVYFGIQNKFQVPLANVIPEEGFNGIAISIISYSNPLLTVVVAFLFGVIQSGIINTGNLANAISPTFISLVIGILMYVSAISSVFIRLKWIYFVRKVMYKEKHNDLYYKYRQKRYELDEIYYSEYSFANNIKKRLRALKNYCIAYLEITKSFNQKLKAKISNEKKEELLKKKTENLQKIKLKYYEEGWQVALIKAHSEKIKNLKTNYIVDRNKILLNKGDK